MFNQKSYTSDCLLLIEKQRTHLFLGTTLSKNITKERPFFEKGRSLAFIDITNL